MAVERRAQESRRERRKIHERRALRRDDEIRQHVDAAVEERVDIPLHAARDILHIHARIAREHLHVVRHRLVELWVPRPTRFVLRDIRQADAEHRPPAASTAPVHRHAAKAAAAARNASRSFPSLAIQTSLFARSARYVSERLFPNDLFTIKYDNRPRISFLFRERILRTKRKRGCNLFAPARG